MLLFSKLFLFFMKSFLQGENEIMAGSLAQELSMLGIKRQPHHPPNDQYNKSHIRRRARRRQTSTAKQRRLPIFLSLKGSHFLYTIVHLSLYWRRKSGEIFKYQKAPVINLNNVTIPFHPIEKILIFFFFLKSTPNLI